VRLAGLAVDHAANGLVLKLSVPVDRVDPVVGRLDRDDQVRVVVSVPWLPLAGFETDLPHPYLLVFEDDPLADRAQLDLCPIGAGDNVVARHGSSLQVIRSCRSCRLTSVVSHRRSTRLGYPAGRVRF
jgi:hypothetical protein